MSKPPTPKQRQAAKAILNNSMLDKPQTQAVVLADVGYGTIVQDPKRIIESVGFKQALQETGLLEALKAQGIHPARIASKIDVLLDATKKQYRNNVTTGEIEEIGVEPDYQAIDKGIKHATSIYGVMEKPITESKNTYNFIFSPEVQDKVKLINEDIKKLLTNVPEIKKDVETQ